ncbi:hypothetical protein EV681_0046 [Advenella incenata]|uniref:Uncharacterized protein n=1 Tax=Advenella incenata TaxID=267800 RepID=A0A4Q7VPD7_9BURK|nr:hypothetical protein [Advenella incenata]RZT98270.1 hypothetical protein EV681_0046 [Advenella incenata]
MDLLQNPFHILNASPWDHRRRIMELADEQSLLVDSDVGIQAQSELTAPRKRLSAEVAWLLGIDSERTRDLLSRLDSSPRELLAVENLPSITRTNLLVAALFRLPFLSTTEVENWIIEISREFENIKSEDLRLLINEARVVSGFPAVLDAAVIDAEIQERRKYYRKIFKSSLDNLFPKDLVGAVTTVVVKATKNGQVPSPILIAELTDFYEVEAQGFLTKEEENITVLVEKLRRAVDAQKPDSVLTIIVKKLVQVMKNWDMVAQPIQVSAKSRGIEHRQSLDLAFLVRDLAIHLFNKHNKLDLSRELVKMLQDVFAEIDTVIQRVSEDADVLDNIGKPRNHLFRK